MRLKSTTLSLSANSINHAQAKQDKKAPYFMNLVMIKGAWTFILSATLDLLHFTHKLPLGTCAKIQLLMIQLIRKHRNFRNFQD